MHFFKKKKKYIYSSTPTPTTADSYKKIDQGFNQYLSPGNDIRTFYSVNIFNKLK